VFDERRRIHVIWPLLVALLPVMPSGANTAAAAAKVNVLANEVRSIRASGDHSDPALLLVYVTDHHGIPLDGIELSLAEGSRSRGRATTTRDGTALLRLTMTGQLTVRAAHVGFVTAEARRVAVQMGSFTAVALPLEVAEDDDAMKMTPRNSADGNGRP
jgi:hypothetical protein